MPAPPESSCQLRILWLQSITITWSVVAPQRLLTSHQIPVAAGIGDSQCALIYTSRAVPLLSISPVFFFIAEDFSAFELDVDRVIFAITFCSFVYGFQ